MASSFGDRDGRFPRDDEEIAVSSAASAQAPESVRRSARSALLRAGADLASRPILITGICGRLGRRLARRLHRERPVLGIDRRDFVGRPKDIAHH
ncbi:MAG: hypothetical protein WKG00_37010, partial [Polyangiaceae bacterium]